MRKAYSAVELVVVIAIMAVLIGLLLGAVQKVRRTATRLQSINHIKQNNLAVLHYVGNYKHYPVLGGANQSMEEAPVFVAMLPYLDQDNYYKEWVKNNGVGGSQSADVKCYLSPADPSGDLYLNRTSYAFNGCLLRWKQPLTPMEITDGTSNTIHFVERYSFGCSANGFFGNDWHLMDNFVVQMVQDGVNRVFARGATVGIERTGDAVPVSSGTPRVTVSSIPGVFFQVAPTMAGCEPRGAQTPHQSGMLVGLADGSVRTLSKGTNESGYMGLLTPKSDDYAGETD